MSRQKKDPAQRELERNQKLLEQVLQLPGNDNCADCGQKGPRWASVNIGIFVCIRCSGIHRNMGTHISKVKSVSLDKWQPEMIEQVRRIGNNNARRIYEGRLPANYRRPHESDGYAIEQWIKDKYDRKRWYDSEAAVEIISGATASEGGSAASQDEERRQRREQRKQERRQRDQEKPRQAAPAAQPAIALFDFETPAQPAQPAQPKPAPQVAAAPSDPNDFFAAFQTSGSSSADFFSQGSQPQQQPQQQRPVQQVPQQMPSQPQQQMPAQPQQQARATPASSKDQIMSLFKNSSQFQYPSNQPQQFQPLQFPQQQQQQQFQPQQQGGYPMQQQPQYGGFGQPQQQFQPQQQYQPQQQMPQQQQQNFMQGWSTPNSTPSNAFNW